MERRWNARAGENGSTPRKPAGKHFSHVRNLERARRGSNSDRIGGRRKARGKMCSGCVRHEVELIKQGDTAGQSEGDVCWYNSSNTPTVVTRRGRPSLRRKRATPDSQCVRRSCRSTEFEVQEEQDSLEPSAALYLLLRASAKRQPVPSRCAGQHDHRFNSVPTRLPRADFSLCRITPTRSNTGSQHTHLEPGVVCPESCEGAGASLHFMRGMDEYASPSSLYRHAAPRQDSRRMHCRQPADIPLVQLRDVTVALATFEMNFCTAGGNQGARDKQQCYTPSTARVHNDGVVLLALTLHVAVRAADEWRGCPAGLMHAHSAEAVVFPAPTLQCCRLPTAAVPATATLHRTALPPLPAWFPRPLFPLAQYLPLVCKPTTILTNHVEYTLETFLQLPDAFQSTVELRYLGGFTIEVLTAERFRACGRFSGRTYACKLKYPVPSCKEKYSPSNNRRGPLKDLSGIESAKRSFSREVATDATKESCGVWDQWVYPCVRVLSGVSELTAYYHSVLLSERPPARIATLPHSLKVEVKQLHMEYCTRVYYYSRVQCSVSCCFTFKLNSKPALLVPLRYGNRRRSRATNKSGRDFLRGVRAILLALQTASLSSLLFVSGAIMMRGMALATAPPSERANHGSPWDRGGLTAIKKLALFQSFSSRIQRKVLANVRNGTIRQHRRAAKRPAIKLSPAECTRRCQRLSTQTSIIAAAGLVGRAGWLAGWYWSGWRGGTREGGRQGNPSSFCHERLLAFKASSGYAQLRHSEMIVAAASRASGRQGDHTRVTLPACRPGAARISHPPTSTCPYNITELYSWASITRLTYTQPAWAVLFITSPVIYRIVTSTTAGGLPGCSFRLPIARCTAMPLLPQDDSSCFTKPISSVSN
ncbi:hypothetical protein PR048_018315 [Dryococelus australis]|uniref:Uncharacterized protein n=1 Tax=Dryococelus australis TaxID=614101 RepID=A0ABQ9HC55_9NEOP|nr:hypothetical protein PR048_018315 [Dryococelus australis]